VGGGDRAPAWAWANVMKDLTAHGAARHRTTAAELQGDTLAERLQDELRAANGIVIAPPMIGACAGVSVT
jgi:FMN-dependent NADH-azoreductase